MNIQIEMLGQTYLVDYDAKVTYGGAPESGPTYYSGGEPAEPMTPVLPRCLDDHVTISRMAKALRPLSELSLHWLRFSWYEVAGIDEADADRLDAFAMIAAMRRREVMPKSRRKEKYT